MAKHLMRPLGRDSYPAGAADYAPAILDAWLEIFPDSQPDERDKEDWVENACFIEAFHRLGIEHEILAETGGAWISASEDSIVSGKGEASFFHTGIRGLDHVTGIEHSLPLQGANCLEAVSRHASSPAFLEIAGRRMELVRPERQAMEEAIRRIVPEDGEIFVKTLKKEMAGRFAIRSGSSAWDQLCDQDEGIMWSMVQYEGNETPFFSVQGVIEPTYEYRMFIVGNEPVCGAGCIEAYTPLNNEQLFDAKMEERRNHSQVTTQQDIVNRYIETAQAFGNRFAEENGKDIAYGLDLCIDANTGKVAAIELNLPMNLGRYASNIDAWVLAIDRHLKEVA